MALTMCCIIQSSLETSYTLLLNFVVLVLPRIFIRIPRLISTHISTLQPKSIFTRPLSVSAPPNTCMCRCQAPECHSPQARKFHGNLIRTCIIFLHFQQVKKKQQKSMIICYILIIEVTEIIFLFSLKQGVHLLHTLSGF